MTGDLLCDVLLVTSYCFHTYDHDDDPDDVIVWYPRLVPRYSNGGNELSA